MKATAANACDDCCLALVWLASLSSARGVRCNGRRNGRWHWRVNSRKTADRISRRSTHKSPRPREQSLARSWQPLWAVGWVAALHTLCFASARSFHSCICSTTTLLSMLNSSVLLFLPAELPRRFTVGFRCTYPNCFQPVSAPQVRGSRLILDAFCRPLERFRQRPS